MSVFSMMEWEPGAFMPRPTQPKPEIVKQNTESATIDVPNNPYFDDFDPIVEYDPSNGRAVRAYSGESTESRWNVPQEARHPAGSFAVDSTIEIDPIN